MALVRPADWNNTYYRISFQKDWHHLHQAAKAHTQMEASNSSPVEKQLEYGRKSTDMDFVKNPVEEVGSFFKMQRNSHHITSNTRTSHTKEQTTALQLDGSEKGVYPPTIAGFVQKLRT